MYKESLLLFPPVTVGNTTFEISRFLLRLTELINKLTH